MTLEIKMSGELQGRRVPGDFKETVQAIEMVKAKGMEFLILEKDDGNHIAFLMDNLNSIEETDDYAF